MNTNSCLVILAVTGLALSAHAQQDSLYPLSIFWYPQQMTNRNQIGPVGSDRPFKFVQFINTNLGNHTAFSTWPGGAYQVSTSDPAHFHLALVPDRLVPAV